MPLSCSCDDEGDWSYYPPDDFSILETRKRKRCCSCKELIDIGSDVAKFLCSRYPEPDSVEERIHGEGCEIPMADKFMCDECAGLYFSLTELGFCLSIGSENMRSLVKDYAELYGNQGESDAKVEERRD